MSRPRYDWWPYVKGMIRRYPELRERFGGIQPPPPDTPVRFLETNAQREHEAVRRAVQQTERYRNGRDRLKVIDLVLWKQSHTIEGAALQVPCSIATAKRYHGDFVRRVAENYGIFDKVDTPVPTK